MRLDRSFDKLWFAIQVRSHCERSVSAMLSFKGYEEFLPLYVKVSKNRRRRTEVPLFPGYLFCRFDADIGAPILTTPGIVRILGTDGIPSIVPDAEIEAVQRIIRSELPRAPSSILQTGTSVRVERGPLLGLCGKIVTSRGRGKLIVSLTLLQRAVSVEVDMYSVVPFAAPHPA